MPYVRIKAYPKDEETKQKVAEEIKDVFVRNWGCPPEALCISIEEVSPDDWTDEVRNPEIIPNENKMYIMDGEKKY